MKYFKALISNNDNNNIDKSFTDSGLSENYGNNLIIYNKKNIINNNK